MKKFLTIFLVILMVFYLFTGCANEVKDNETPAGTETDPTSEENISIEEQVLKVGVVMPLTGNNAESGKMQVAAIELAAKEINDEGGIGGKIKIDLFIEDDENVPAKSSAVTQKLCYNDEVNVVIGANASSCTLVDMEVTSKAGVPHIAPGSTALAIVEQGNEWIFRTACPDTLTMFNVLSFCKSQGYSSFALIHDSADFGMNAKEFAADYAADLGLTYLTDYTFTLGDTDFSTGLLKIRNDSPDVIVLWSQTAEASKVLSQRIQYGLNDIPLVGYAWNYPTQLLELCGGEAIDGTIVASAFSLVDIENNPELKAFVDNYNEYYGGDPSQNAANCYDTMYLIADAVKRCGVDKPIDNTALRDALRTSDFNGVNGKIAFDERGEIIKDLYMLRFDAEGVHHKVEW
jgi:branched-chain amino acid transport system substrate-binding protein